MAGVKGSRAYPLKIGAGLETTLNVGGEFFYVLECDQADFLMAMDESGLDFTKLRTYKRVEQGAQYDSLRIFNPNASDLNLKIIAGFGEYGDDEVKIGGAITVTSITNPVALSTATFPDGLTEITRKGHGQAGASFAQAAFTAGVTTIVAPAANTNGIVLRVASFYCATHEAAIYTDTAAPSGWNDVTKQRLFVLSSAQGHEVRDIFIPAGDGLYVAMSGTSGHYNLSFDIL